MFTEGSPLVLIESYAADDGQKKVEKKKRKLTTGILSTLLSLLQCRKRMKQNQMSTFLCWASILRWPPPSSALFLASSILCLTSRVFSILPAAPEYHCMADSGNNCRDTAFCLNTRLHNLTKAAMLLSKVIKASSATNWIYFVPRIFIAVVYQKTKIKLDIWVNICMKYGSDLF